MSDRPMSEAPVASLVSLGCSKNQVDSERVAASLVQEGFLLAADPADADIALVNTCAFLESARAETRDVLAELQDLKKRSRLKAVVALGCYPSKTGNVPGADAVVPFKDYKGLAAACRKALGLGPKAADSEPPTVLGCSPRLRFGLKAAAYLKIAEGCSNRCAYCSIPSIRGALASRPMEDILREAGQLVADGARELVLIGQDTAAYGRDLAQAGLPQASTSLAGLMKGLLGVKGFRWLRLMYAHPSHLGDDVIELLGERRVARYLDLPIQHADDSVLAAMRRPYRRKDLSSLISKLRSKVPGIALRTTCLVGFPGETPEAFDNLLSFVKETGFDHLGAFTYSREPGTSAFRLAGQVEERVKQERLARLMTLQKKAAARAGRPRVGERVDVLVEEPAASTAASGRPEVRGRCQYQAPEVDGKTIVTGNRAGLARLRPGSFCRAVIIAGRGYDLAAKLSA